jgi:hypothetical protein
VRAAGDSRVSQNGKAGANATGELQRFRSKAQTNKGNRYQIQNSTFDI